MTPGRGIVLDANILIRAALGRRVRALLEAYEDSVAFYTPDVCFDDAREYIPRLFGGRGDDPETGMAVLDQIGLLVQPVDEALSGLWAARSGANGRARRRRPAGCRRGPHAERPRVDRGSGFLWQRHCHMDDRSSRVVPAGPPGVTGSARLHDA